jgi:hypothetical protein
MRAVYDFLLERFESERDALAGAVPAESVS